MTALPSLAPALLNGCNDAPRFGSAAKKLIQDEYSAERMTADYLRVYDEAIAAVKQERAK